MTSYCMYVVLIFIGSMMMVYASESSQSDMFDNVEGKRLPVDEIQTNKRPSFFVGSRYGRSSDVYGTKARRLSVAPRNDRFFLGSRYGKRSSEYMPAVYEQDSSNQSNFFTMTCIHTGFKNFFRCSKVNDINNFIQHLTNDEADSK